MQRANMTGLAQPSNPGKLRHQDPPKLWRNVFAGSVGVHLLLLLTVPTLLQAVAGQSEAGMQVTTPIELVDLDSLGVGSPAIVGEGSTVTDAANTDAANPAAAIPTASTQAPAPAIAPPPTPVPQSAIPSAFAPTALGSDRPLAQSPTPVLSPPPPAPQPSISPNPSPSTLTSPLPQPSIPSDIANPTESASSPDPLPEPSSPAIGQPEIGQPEIGEPAPSQSDLGETLPDAPNPYSGEVATNPIPGGGVAGTGNPDASGNTPGAGLSEVSVNSQGLPTSLTVSVVRTSQLPPSETADTPDQSAILLANSFTVVADPTQPGACQITPESVNFFGATVAMRVTVALDGRVSETPIRQSSGSTEYDNLASCLVKQNLRFTPASTAGIATPSDNLVVSITVVGS